MIITSVEKCPKCEFGFIKLIEQGSHLEPNGDNNYIGYYLDKYQCDKCGYTTEKQTNFTMDTSGVIIKDGDTNEE